MGIRAAMLGPLEIRVDGEPVDLGPTRQRLVLGMLLLCRDGVGVDRLVDLLWPDPPRNAVNKLQGYITALRHILQPDRAPRTPSLIERSGTQYRLRLPPASTDVEEFRDHITRAADLVGPAVVHEYVVALELWRGPVLDGLADSTQVPEIVGLQAMIRDAVISAAELARAAAAPDAGILHWLLKAVEEWRYDESLYAALIYTYARLGRLDQAHDAYRLIRGRLDAELGVEPGTQLQSAYSLVLRGVDDERPGGLGNRLPRPAAEFVGRHTLRAELACGLSSAAPVVLISGPPGVGKTALAVRAAADNAEHFPDGQIFVSLRVGGQPRSTDDVLYDLLVSLGVQARSIPESPVQRRALYASITAARRILLVLDDAGSAADVRDLLPAGDLSGLIVTCRSHLPALDCRTRIKLSPLSTEDSVGLLDGLVDGRLSGEMLRQFARQCGNLPLALRIVAGRVGHMPAEAIADFAARLSDERQRLNELSLDDLEVRAGLQASWSGLTADAARGLALLSVLDAPAVDPMALGAITGGAAGWPEIEQLTNQHLLDSAGYSLRMHDLVRVFARERCDGVDAAIDNAARWYIATFTNAQGAVFPGQAIDLGIVGELSAPPREFDDNAAAILWLTEHAVNTQRLVLQANSLGRIKTSLLSRFTGVWGRYADHVGLIDAWERMLDAAMQTALLAHDAAAEQTLLIARSVLDIRRGNFQKAHDLLRDALESGVGITGRNEAVAYNNLAGVLNDLGRSAKAVEPARHAVAAFRGVGDQRGAAMALNNLARAYDQAGEIAAAARTVDELFAVASEFGMDDVFGFAHNARGDVARSGGDDEAAARHYRLAEECGQAADDRRIQAYALHHLGRLGGAGSDPMELLRRADVLYREIGDTAGADEVRQDMLVSLP